LRKQVDEITGRLCYVEEGIPSTSEMRVAIPRRLRRVPLDQIGPYRVIKISPVDGTKLYLENDNWALLRFSGTEPILRLSAEADSPEKANTMIQWLKQFVTVQ
jgi:phosphomannomutase